MKSDIVVADLKPEVWGHLKNCPVAADLESKILYVTVGKALYEYFLPEMVDCPEEVAQFLTDHKPKDPFCGISWLIALYKMELIPDREKQVRELAALTTLAFFDTVG